ncbi:MAG: hypothetical protein JXR37_37415 [Kiritimatiellae bacterium]|nr:hypothetical protein [Kiritimatiellia bacterium]
MAGRLAGMPAAELEGLVRDMGQQQPIILAYVLAVGKDVYEEDERQVLLYLCVVIWQAMCAPGGPEEPVDEATLNRVDAANADMLDYLGGESDADFRSSVKLIVGHYNQPEVLRCVVDALMKGRKGRVRPAYRGTMLLDLKTVIDCFDRYGG